MEDAAMTAWLPLDVEFQVDYDKTRNGWVISFPQYDHKEFVGLRLDMDVEHVICDTVRRVKAEYSRK